MIYGIYVSMIPLVGHVWKVNYIERLWEDPIDPLINDKCTYGKGINYTKIYCEGENFLNRKVKG